ncbi:MAG: hypothetical protein R2705_14110 [Ilumatobacteraceae bacterium]
MKWLVDTLGFDEVQRRVLSQRRLLVSSSSWPGGIPVEVRQFGDAPAGRSAEIAATAMGQGVPVTLRSRDDVSRWRGQRGRGHGERFGLRLRLGPSRRHHAGAVPSPGRHPA